MKRTYSLYLFIICSISVLNAQTDSFSAEDVLALQERATETVATFCKHIEIIGNKKQSVNIRDHYIKSILNLFFEKENVMMEVSILNNKKNANSILPLENYLKKLTSLSYEKVEMKNIDTCNINDLHKVDNYYEASLIISCKFCGYDVNGKKQYGDITNKQIQIYIVPEKDGVLGEYWNVKLGSMKVLNTRKL